jgi:hypothetical protein
MPRLTALAGLLFLTAPAAADDALYTAAVARPEIEVRSMPGDGPQAAVTNRLRQGGHVNVVKDMGNGWLAILPPDSSFSWVNTRFIERISTNLPLWVVSGHGDERAPIQFGSDLRPGERLPVISARVACGTQLRAIGPSVADDEGTWLRIEPPAGELRYVRADDVVKSTTPQIAARPAEVPQPGAVTPPRPAPVGVEARWQQAMQAERTSQIAAAVALYDQISIEAQQSNPDLATQARNRAHWLREAYRAPDAGPNTPIISPHRPPEQVFTPAGGGQRVVPVPIDPGRPAPERPVTPCVPGDPAFPQAPSQPGNPWATPRSPEGHPSSGAGVLRRAGRVIEGQRTYVLESLQGYPTLYVTAQTGLDLEPYVNGKVELFGPAIYRGELRANYMIAVRVQLLP